MKSRTIEKVDLDNIKHCEALVVLLNKYMKDEKGAGKPMPQKLGAKILHGLKMHSAYLEFLVKINEDYVALVNCNLNYSAWQASPFINIHDFIVYPTHRKKGIGKFLLYGIKDFACEKAYCKINLEVREDNSKAKKLYRSTWFSSCSPVMLFWEMKL